LENYCFCICGLPAVKLLTASGKYSPAMLVQRTAVGSGGHTGHLTQKSKNISTKDHNNARRNLERFSVLLPEDWKEITFVF